MYYYILCMHIIRYNTEYRFTYKYATFIIHISYIYRI